MVSENKYIGVTCTCVWFFFFLNFLISKLIGDNITHDQQRYSETNAVSLIDLFLSPVKMPFNVHLELIQNGSNLL